MFSKQRGTELKEYCRERWLRSVRVRALLSMMTQCKHSVFTVCLKNVSKRLRPPRPPLRLRPRRGKCCFSDAPAECSSHLSTALSPGPRETARKAESEWNFEKLVCLEKKWFSTVYPHRDIAIQGNNLVLDLQKKSSSCCSVLPFCSPSGIP